MINQQIKEKEVISFDENINKLQKIKFCIISNCGYKYLTSSLQNFVLDY